MKIIHTIKTVGLISAFSISSIVLSSCDDDSSASSSNNIGLTTDAIAFTNSLNQDPDFDVKVVLSESNQDGFIVIYDPLTDSFDAIKISAWDSNTPASDFYYNNSATFFFDLFKLDDNKYADLFADLIFESSISPVNVIERDFAPSSIQRLTFNSIIESSSPNVADEIGDQTQYILLSDTEIEIKFPNETESGTYTYNKISSDQASFTETTQDGTSTIELVFISNSTGTFREEFREGNSDTGPVEFFEGTFTIEP